MEKTRALVRVKMDIDTLKIHWATYRNIGGALPYNQTSLLPGEPFRKKISHLCSKNEHPFTVRFPPPLLSPASK